MARHTPTRSVLLDAAQERFAVHGYTGTSIRDLARAAGIKESSVYAHFPNKRAIFDAVLARARARIAETARAYGAPLEDLDASADTYSAMTAQRLEEVAFAFLELCVRDDAFVATRRILALEQYRDTVASAQLRALIFDEPLAYQREIFERLIAAGTFAPASPESVALAFWGPIHAIVSMVDGADAVEQPVLEKESRRLLRLHLAHFAATHLAHESSQQ